MTTAALPPIVEETQLDANLLESTGAVIGRVSIANKNIFDLQNAEEDKALFRFANRAHVITRPGVIQQQLLFSSGEKFSSQAQTLNNGKASGWVTFLCGK